MNLLSLLLTATAAAADTTKEAAEPIQNISKIAQEFSGLPVEQVVEKLISGAVDLVIKLAIAIIVFYVGKFIINRIHKSIKKLLIHRQVDKSLTTLILSFLKVVLYFVLIIIVISILGIETSSFVAIFASAGVAIGLALSGTLQNFAGGVLILLIKPYKVGDFIEAQGYSGTVKEIQIFNTVLNTTDNKCIFIPNGGLSTGSINNYSKEDYRRVDWTVNISYGNDYQVARKAILDIINNDSRIVKKYIEDDREMRAVAKAATAEPTPEPEEQKGIKRLFSGKEKVVSKLQAIANKEDDIKALLPKIDRAPFIALSSLSSSSVDIIVRVWVPSSLYWEVYYDINEKIYNELPKAGISFPFPQMDVHLYSAQAKHTEAQL